MFTIKYNAKTNHIDGLTVRTTGGGNDMGGYISDYSQNACGSLTRYRFAEGKSYATVAEALHAAETSGRNLCKTCKAAAEAMITAEAEKVFAEAATTEGETVTTEIAETAPETADSAIISEAATADTTKTQGETMAETTTDAKLDVTTEDGAKALEQIDANIERAKVLATEDSPEALEELGKETETIISNLSGKGSIKAKKEKRDAWKAAVEAAEKPKGEVKKVSQGKVEEKTWDQYEGTVELVNAAAEKLSEGVNAHLKTSHVAKDVAAVTLEAWLRVPNSAGAPDLMGDKDQSKKLSKEILRLAGQGFEKTYDNEQALKKLMRSVQDQRSDVRAEWLRSLDQEDETGAERRALMAKVLEGKPEDEKASEWVANVYGTSTIGQTEKRRLEYAAKKELEAGTSAEGGSGEGEGEGEGAEETQAETPVNPDEYMTKLVDRLYKDVEKADPDTFEKASDEVKKTERERLEAIKKAVTAMIAATL